MILKRPPTVEFDPSIKSHRLAVHGFMKRNAWGDCPMRFARNPTFNSISDQVKSSLLEWYVANEQRSIRQKSVQLKLDLK